MADAAQNVKDVIKVYDSYLAAAKAGDVEKMLSHYTAERQKEFRKEIAKEEMREDFMMMSRYMMPESYEAKHSVWSKDGARCSVYVESTLPAIPGMRETRGRMESMLRFEKEKAGWKMDGMMILADLDGIKRPKDLNCNADDANTDSDGSVSGRIVSIEFMKDHTVVILRVLDTEMAVFLPSKKALLDANAPLECLVPWNLYQFNGYPHKTDELKFFAEGGCLVEDEP